MNTASGIFCSFFRATSKSARMLVTCSAASLARRTKRLPEQRENRKLGRPGVLMYRHAELRAQLVEGLRQLADLILPAHRE